MTLPEVVALCDAVELATIVLGTPLFDKDISKQFYPGQVHSDVEAEIKDMLELARARHRAIPLAYPFTVTDRSITYSPTSSFNAYTYLLLGRALEFGGPKNGAELLRDFRKHFEDIVCWSLKQAGFAAEVLSEPREFRGLDVKLAAGLRQISDRFKESAILRQDRLSPHDNDLDVDVISMPITGNGSRGGWPSIQIQCATGAIAQLEAKLGEGSLNFGTVWESGFFPGSRIRAVATPDDLLKLSEVFWLRLGHAGWVLDRTRIVHLSSGGKTVPLLKEVTDHWNALWAARTDIAWQTGWQRSS